MIVDGHCCYYTASGRRLPGNSDWEGKQTMRKQGDRIGTLLDLDQESMTVWKNDVKLGVMKAQGLSGPLCWAVCMFCPGSIMRIDSAPLTADA